MFWTTASSPVAPMTERGRLAHVDDGHQWYSFRASVRPMVWTPAGAAVAPVLRHAFDDDLAPVEPPEDEPVDLAALAHGPEAVCFPHGIDAEGGAEGHGNGEGPQLRGDEFDAGERALHLMLLDAGLAFPGDLRRGEHPCVGHFKDDVAEGAYAHDASPP